MNNVIIQSTIFVLLIGPIFSMSILKTTMNIKEWIYRLFLGITIIIIGIFFYSVSMFSSKDQNLFFWLTYILLTVMIIYSWIIQIISIILLIKTRQNIMSIIGICVIFVLSLFVFTFTFIVGEQGDNAPFTESDPLAIKMILYFFGFAITGIVAFIYIAYFIIISYIDMKYTDMNREEKNILCKIRLHNILTIRNYFISAMIGAIIILILFADYDTSQFSVVFQKRYDNINEFLQILFSAVLIPLLIDVLRVTKRNDKAIYKNKTRRNHKLKRK